MYNRCITDDDKGDVNGETNTYKFIEGNRRVFK